MLPVEHGHAADGALAQRAALRERLFEVRLLPQRDGEQERARLVFDLRSTAPHDRPKATEAAGETHVYET